MKEISTLTISILLTFSVYSQTRPINRVTTWYGSWSSPSNWSLNRLPQDGDSIVVAGGKVILVDKPYNLNNVYIAIRDNGSFIHLKGKLVLNDASIIEIGIGAKIMAFGSSRSSETISIGNTKKYDQNANTNIYGFGVASNFTGTSPNGFISDMNQALPVTFTSFYKVKKENGVNLLWSTAQEKDNSHFEVEKSTDGRSWRTIAIIFGNDNTQSVSNYSYFDKGEANEVYYRIRQVDNDGNAVYTAIRAIKSGSTSEAKIYLISKNGVTIDFNRLVSAEVTVNVVNLSGQVVASKTFSNPSYKVNL